MIDTEKPNDIIDTTDCLEAVGAFKAMKNFLFTVAMICLILLQFTFILDRMGYIDKSQCSCQASAVRTCSSGCSHAPEPVVIEEEPQGPPPPVVDAATEKIDSEVVDKITADAQTATEEIALDDQKEESSVITETVEEDSGKKEISQMLIPKSRHMAALIKTCNFVLIIAVTLYSLMLLIILKISLTARLGGINHISRALFLSLFALVFLLPWQLCFPSVIAGAIYTPKELLCRCGTSNFPSGVRTIFCYLRFTGLWIIEILLLFFAQLRSMRWSKATLRRLGILQ
jgi:hypothetical protein